MGAACQGSKVADQVSSGAIKSKVTLSKQAQEHLASLKKEDPLAEENMTASFKLRMDDSAAKNREGEETKIVDIGEKQGFDTEVERMHEPLWKAIEANDTEAATKFLALNDVQEQNLYDASGQSMLHRAVALGSVEMLMLLVEKTGTTTDLVNAQLSTLLHVACRSNHQHIIKFLIGCGIEANAQDEHGQTPLLICCIHGYNDLASILVESSIAGHLPEALDADTGDHRGLTPLNCAAIKGDLGLVKILVSRGGCDANQTSPKGCTPLIYAGRGGYSEVVRFLLDKRASPLKQDNAGGTVLHHSIEKGHLQVLEVLLEHGVDVYSAIEIADNGGRTPLFEAVETTPESEEAEQKIHEIIRILTRKKSKNDGGFGAQVNVLNYSGQTPLFQAAKENNLSAVKLLIEMGAKVDLNGGEIVKQEDQEIGEQYENVHEQCFMEAYMQCCTPLHVAATLGYDEIALFLIENGADVNLRSNYKKYSAVHLAVLSNKPEMLIELLTKSNVDPMIEDAQGRTLLDMVYQYNPTYVESFQVLLENLQSQRLQVAQDHVEQATVATHFVNPDDEREIKGVHDKEAIDDMYQHQVNLVMSPSGGQLDLAGSTNKKSLNDVDEHDIDVEDEGEMHPRIEVIYGRKITIALIAADWKYKEMGVKYISKQTEKMLAKAGNIDIRGLVEAGTCAVGVTCREKVMKVFNLSLQLFNILVSSSKIQQDPVSMQIFKDTMMREGIVPKLLLKSEESNTRLTNKIHEALLDLSYHPKIGEDIVASAILQRIEEHYQVKQPNHKGLLAQLALLYKLINSFGLSIPNNEIDEDQATGSVLTVQDVLEAAVPSLALTNADVKNAATKIVLDVQRLSGAVKDHYFARLPEKIQVAIIAKVVAVKPETELNQTKKRDFSDTRDTGGLAAMQQAVQNKVNVVNVGMGEIQHESSTENLNEAQEAMLIEIFERNKLIVIEKCESKDWQIKELALQAMQECFENCTTQILKSNEEFITTCTTLLKSSIEENNMQIYIVAVQVASIFLAKTLEYEIVMDTLPSLIKSIVLHTTDTNTRVRKKSVDLINQIWESSSSHPAGGVSNLMTGAKKVSDNGTSNIIATVLVDSQLGEKAIVGRLGLFIKKCMNIESGEELNKQAHQQILGRDYEQLTEFSCQWCMHKTKKVRQCALKLIVEICRLNHIDPRGQPFKQRIINFILGLRHSLRDPLVKKINEVCQQETKTKTASAAEDGDAEAQADQNEPYIIVEELELNLATKNMRAASLDVRNKRREQATQGVDGRIGTALPTITGGMPSVAPVSTGNRGPTIVLPHSEPLTDELKEAAKPFLQLFSMEIMTCFYSQTWSTRQAAFQKIEEQLLNLDPKRRDAMYGEINHNNLPPEVSFQVFLQLMEEGFKDPVLKNYLLILELIQKALPIYFRYLQPQQIQNDLIPTVKMILTKTSDLKSKVREASINFCLYLSHQSPIGPATMIKEVLNELTAVQSENANAPRTPHANAGRNRSPTKNSSKANEKPTTAGGTNLQVSTTFGNSHLIASCIMLLTQFQQQAGLINSMTSQFFVDYMMNINKALRHSNPQVRKQAENLFKILYASFGDELIPKLIDQKPALQQKLIKEAKVEASQAKPDSAIGYNNANQTSAPIGLQKPKEDENMLQRKTTMQLKEGFLEMAPIKELLAGNEDLITQLKLPNPKKRLKAIVEIKKVVQRKFATLSSAQARDLLEPLQLLVRELLKDDSQEVYLEALNLLKFIVGSLAPHLTGLDLHLMIGQFIGLIVTNAGCINMRIRVASDKVVIYFAKHSNIGSFIVAKEVLKNIERISTAMKVPPPSSMSQEEYQEELRQKMEVLVRLFSILQMLLQQFSIVLCYQQDFYVQSLGHIADAMNAHAEKEPALKSTCTQLVISLCQIDAKLLEQGVNKLDFTKKTPIRKVMIEYENQTLKGANINVMTGNDSFNPQGAALVADAGERDRSPEHSMRDTQQSFSSLHQSQAPYGYDQMNLEGISPGPGRRVSQAANSTHSGWNERHGSEVRMSRKATDLGSLPSGRNQVGRVDSMRMTGQSWADQKRAGGGGDGFLPDINSGGLSGRRRPPVAESLSGAGQGRAAGFRRDRASDAGTNPTLGSGMPSGYKASPTKSERRLFGSTKESPRYGGQPVNQDAESTNFGGNPDYQKPASPGVGSARRSSGLRMSGGVAGLDVGASLDSQNPNRPPLYVPSRRDPNLARQDSMGNNQTFGKPPTDNARGPKSTAAQEYQFRSDLYSEKPSGAETRNPHPFFARQPSQGSSGGSHAYVPTQVSSSGFGGTGFSSQSNQGGGFSGNNAGAGFNGSSSNKNSGPSAGMLQDINLGGSASSPTKPKPPKPKPAMPPPAAVSFSVKTDDYGASKKANQTHAIVPQSPPQ